MDHYTRSSLNFFAALTVDRLSTRRLDEVWIQKQIRDRRSRIIPVWRSRNLLTGADELKPVLLSAADLDDQSALEEHAVLLGSCGDTVYFAIDLSEESESVAARFGNDASLCV